jgi:hypothetical protein
MYRSMTRTLFLLSLVAYAVPAAAQSLNLSGEWVINLKTPRGNLTLTATIKQEGERISGQAVGMNLVKTVQLEGTIQDQDVKVVCIVPIDNNFVQISLTGKVDGDSISGKADFAGVTAGDWSAKRLVEGSRAGTAKLPINDAQSGHIIDVSGTWRVRVETETGFSYPICTFKQEGETLTGQCKTTFDEAPLVGIVKDNKIKFWYKVQTQDDEVIITYSGRIEKDLLEGTGRFGETRLGTWTARRQ